MTIQDLLLLPPFEWPPETADLLHEVLTDRGAPAEDREVAANLAGDLVVLNEQLAADLIAIVESPEDLERVRAMAAIGLGPALEECFDEGFEDLPITEEIFDRILQTLRQVYADPSVPKLVRRRVLEGAVRAPESWQEEAVREAYATGDQEWVLTAVFAMQFMEGFEREVLESLKNPDPEIHREAVISAGAKELDEAWGHVKGLLTSHKTPKDLLIAAIEAAGYIRPEQAHDILLPFSRSQDEEIAEAATDALQIFDDIDEDDEV